MKKLFLTGVILAALVVVVFAGVVVPLREAASLPDEVRLTNDEFNVGVRITKGRFLTQQINRDIQVGDTTEQYIDVRLLGVFKVKRVKVSVLPFDRVVVGGFPIGFVVKTDGVIVLENARGLKKGDIIKSIGTRTVTSVEDLAFDGEETVVFLRGGKTMTTRFAEGEGGTRSLGLWLKDETSGVGMLTYVNPANNNFASLGHQLSDFETSVPVDVLGGDVYCCNIIGIEKASGRRVGELKSTLKQGSEGRQGSVLSSSPNGVFGCLYEDSVLLKAANEELGIGTRYSVRPGAAKLRTSLDGMTTRDFDVEIIKNRFQRNPADKSMLIRVTDKSLLDATGGIIHGMSGSPIIQNGKIVGALTHVMVNDVTKGYGIYIDFVVP